MKHLLLIHFYEEKELRQGCWEGQLRPPHDTSSAAGAALTAALRGSPRSLSFILPVSQDGRLGLFTAEIPSN